MRRLVFALLVSLLFILPGCGAEQSADTDSDGNNTISERIVYHSDVPAEDCYLCGGRLENMLRSWGENNIALFSLNTFEVKPIEINRYDKSDGHLIEEPSGVMSLGGGGSQNGGFSVNIMLDYDRGYAVGSIEFFNDETLDIEAAATFLCADCLNGLLPGNADQCVGVGAVNLATGEVHVLEKAVSGFTLGDFYIGCNLEGQDLDSDQTDILIFYCPIRYEESCFS